MLDTNVIQTLFEEGGYIFDGGEPSSGGELDPDLGALREVMRLARRLGLQLVTSSLSVAEVLNIQSVPQRRERLGWFLEMLDFWTLELDATGGRVRDGGVVRHRFKLDAELQQLEAKLLAIPDFRRDPFDRLLLIQSRLAACDVLLTQDRRTLWRHRSTLADLDIILVTPTEYWEMLRPYAAL